MYMYIHTQCTCINENSCAYNYSMLAKAVKTINKQKQQTSSHKGLRKYSSSHPGLEK